MTTMMSVDDGQVPGKTKEEKEETLKSWYLLNLNRYYKDTEYCTFQTEFIPFSVEIGLIWQKVNRGAVLSEKEEIKWREEVVNPLENAIKRFPKGAFVKLSTRSPKDAVDKDIKRLKALIKLNGNESMNERYIKLRNGFIQTMRVLCASDALNIMSKSARIISDLIRALEFRDIWDMQLVVREFVDFTVTDEFRGFFHGGKLTALSQYDTACFHKHDKIDIMARIDKFMETFPIQIDCVIDFVITKETIYVVELNPFTESSGCALFNWSEDQSILEQGPFEFRVLECERDEKYLAAIMNMWSTIIKECTFTKDTGSNVCLMQ